MGLVIGGAKSNEDNFKPNIFYADLNFDELENIRNQQLCYTK